MRAVWGLDIGGTKCAIVSGDAYGQVHTRAEIATREYHSWQETVDALLARAPSEAPACVGVSCGGPLSSARGRVLSPPNLPGWDDVPITDYLSQKLGVPAYLQNDANACALAEYMYGAGRGTKNMVFLTFGTGLGAGLILNGRLYAGGDDMAGEIGHIRLSARGPKGYGKAGSFEGFCSGGGIERLAGVSAKEACARAMAGDAQMRRVIDTSARALGRAAALLIDLLNPEKIVIGSIYARAEALFAPEMHRVCAREALPISYAHCAIVPAQLGDRVGDIAALTVALYGMEERGEKYDA